MTTKLGFIGGGNMASSLIGGLLQQAPGRADDILVFEPNEERAALLSDKFQLQLAASNQELITQAEIVVLAVKPQVLRSVLQPLKDYFKATHPLVISIVAGVRSASIEEWLEGEFAVVRAMPNTPALVGAGATGVYANRRVTAAQKSSTEDLLNTVGESFWVNDEADIDTVTALSGSGPAYFMLFIKSLADAAQAAGLDSQTSKHLAVATAAGAAKLIANSDESLQTLINNVTSPNGTTEQALKSFDANNLSGIVAQAFEAARHRSQELADEMATIDLSEDT